MTLDMYFGSLAVATLPTTLSLITFVAIMVAGGLVLNGIAWLYTSMVEAEEALDQSVREIDTLLTRRWEEAVALSVVDHLYARMKLAPAYQVPWMIQPVIMALVENGRSSLQVGQIPAYMQGWPEAPLPAPSVVDAVVPVHCAVCGCNMGDVCDNCGSVDTIEAAEDDRAWLDSIRCPDCGTDYEGDDICSFVCDMVGMGFLTEAEYLLEAPPLSRVGTQAPPKQDLHAF